MRGIEVITLESPVWSSRKRSEHADPVFVLDFIIFNFLIVKK